MSWSLSVRRSLPPYRVAPRCWGPLLLASVSLIACSESTPVQPPPAEPTAVPAFVAPAAPQAASQSAGFAPGQIIARFTPGANRAAVAATQNATLDRELISDVWLLRVPEGAEAAVAQALDRNPNIEYAEPDYLRVLDDPLCPTCQSPNDGSLEWQWDMHNDGDVDYGFGLVFPTNKVDADIDWLEAYDHLGPTPGGSAMIGILDTGILGTHEDFCGKQIVWKNFYDETDVTPGDDHGHGSHVSGIAGACADNGAGVVGVGYWPSIGFVSGKVCDINGECLASSIATAIAWAADNGANVINMSFGDTQPSQAESDALAYAMANNVLPVCGAGNEGSQVVLYPAADPNCVAVSGTDYGDELASYSSYGPPIEVAAPGGDLEDPLFGTSFIFSVGNGWDSDYIHRAGTSMAAPHVAGLAAVLYALGVTDATQIRNCLRNTADDLGPAGWDEQFGFGRINMYQAVTNTGSCGGGGGGGDNVAPNAAFDVTCNGFDCDFDASASWDPDGIITSYAWNFGDGSTGSGVTTSHTFGTPGDHTVTLTALDDDGAPGMSIQTFAVGIIHIADLDGLSEVGKGNRWDASVTATVMGVDGLPVSGASVSMSWTGLASGSASRNTGSDGTATFKASRIRGIGQVTFTVGGVTHSSFAYDAARNSDPDGDSDGNVIVVESPNKAPEADFTEVCDEVGCTFTDLSTDDDGTIVAWHWAFGDGFESTEQNPVHPYALPFFYLVTLTVTDDKGATDALTKQVFVPAPDVGLVLSAVGDKVKGQKQALLTWSGGDGITPMDVYRNDAKIDTTPDDGEYLDVIGRGGETTYTYWICLEGSNLCSNTVTVTF